MLTLLSFNQDKTCLAAASEKAFAIFNCDPFDSCYTCAQHTVSVAEMLFSTSLVAIVDPAVGTSCLRIINTKKNSTICELAFPARITAIKMNRKRIVVFLTAQVLIYDVSCMKLLHKIDMLNPCPAVGPQNEPEIACDLSSSDLSILAFQQFDPSPESTPGDSNNGTSNSNDKSNNLGPQSGNAVIFDALNVAPICIVNCHKTGLQKLTLSENGVLLASASKKGTIVRIFNTQTGARLCEFRRGSLPASICSLSFNSTNTVLACSSTTGTVHFFNVPEYIAHLGVSKDIGSSLLSSTPAQTTTAATDTPTAGTTSPSPPSLSPTPPKELPKSSLLSTEENDEVQKLMASVDVLAEGGKRESAFQKTKNLTNLLWSQSKHYLPQHISSIIEPKRDYAFIHLPTVGKSTIGLFESTCYIATADGMFLQYSIPSPQAAEAALAASSSSNSPIECKLVKHHQIPL